ncbi:MAG: restriction endonuclease subunit S [Streptococcus mitis]|jgi:hsdS|nr:restriction endonuclease subunit S [Streptococcus mitis]
MTKQPSYRFAGYTESWEEKKLGEVSTITMGQSPNSENYTVNPNDYILVQGNADMKNGRVFPRVWTTQITKQARQGDLILSVRAPVGDIGKTDYDVVLGRGVASIDGNEFLYQALSQMKQNGYWSKLSTGSTFESINSNDIKSAIISLPSLPEQTAIGSFFQDIDQLISLQQRKLEVLKEQKKTYLKLLFPTKGQTKPALRFAGFEDEWQEVKLGDFVEISKGIQRNKEFLSPNADSKNCYPVYNGGKQESGYTDEFNREGNIMISEGGASAGFVNYFDGKYWSGGHNFTIDELENDIDYVLALLESQQQELYSLQVGSGLPNIQLNSLKKVIITFPAFLEQQAIGSFFQDLDKAIAKQVEKVNQLKESKQTLLRKMFI